MDNFREEMAGDEIQSREIGMERGVSLSTCAGMGVL
jgi:hypothetical protein